MNAKMAKINSTRKFVGLQYLILSCYSDHQSAYIGQCLTKLQREFLLHVTLRYKLYYMTMALYDYL